MCVSVRAFRIISVIHIRSCIDRIVSRVNIGRRKLYSPIVRDKTKRARKPSVWLLPPEIRKMSASPAAHNFFLRTGREMGNFGRPLRDPLNYDIIKISSRDSSWCPLPLLSRLFGRDRGFFLFCFFFSGPCVVGVPVARCNALSDTTRYFRFSRPSRLRVDRTWSRIIREKASTESSRGHALFVLSHGRFCNVARCEIAVSRAKLNNQNEHKNLG